MKKIIWTVKPENIRNSTTASHYFSKEEQVSIINQLFLDCDASYCNLLSQELERKRYSYYQQDLRKERVTSINDIISKEDLISKLVTSKLKCKYCHKSILLFYKLVRDPLQWTLDRIDNYLAHTNSNTCVACLECNLQRRRKNADAFAFTKNLVIKKTD